MNKKSALLLFSITASVISIQSYACGVPPSGPFVGSCSQFSNHTDYNECQHLNDLAIRNYEEELAAWESCDMNDPNYGADGSQEPPPLGRWENREITICTVKNVPIYGGHKWFSGTKKWAPPTDQFDVGMPCDDVFVTETLNQYVDYYDWDGITQCDAYLGGAIRIDVRETCKTSTHRVWVIGQ